jgi:glyoxylase-like metal-dependent hydrolase (beta-lactamase superfamily II)
MAGGEALVVDPLRAFTDRYRSDAADRDAEIVAVVDTHLHADHVSGLRDLADATGVTRYMPAESVARGVTYEVETLGDGDEIHVGQSALHVIALAIITAITKALGSRPEVKNG